MKLLGIDCHKVWQQRHNALGRAMIVMLVYSVFTIVFAAGSLAWKLGAGFAPGTTAFAGAQNGWAYMALLIWGFVGFLLVRSFFRNGVFTETSALLLMVLGISMVPLPIVYGIFSDGSGSVEYCTVIGYGFVGVLILLISEVMRTAIKMREENELTI